MELSELIVSLRDHPFLALVDWWSDLYVIYLHTCLVIKCLSWPSGRYRPVLALTLTPSIFWLLMKSKVKIEDCFLSCNLPWVELFVFKVFVSSCWCTVEPVVPMFVAFFYLAFFDYMRIGVSPGGFQRWLVIFCKSLLMITSGKLQQVDVAINYVHLLQD